MIIAIRIKGIPSVPKDIEKTLHLLRLRQKFSATLLQENEITQGMLKKVHAYVAYGKIDKETLKELILKRGRLLGNKLIQIDAKNIDNFAESLIAGKARLQDMKLKPFFRLHPPRHGFKKSTLTLYPRGTLGNHNEKINELLRRML